MAIMGNKLWPTALTILLSLLVLRYILAPLFLETITKLRIRSVSFRSIRGIEWKGKGAEAPHIRIERVGWEKSKREGAWFTIVVEGVSVKITKYDKGEAASLVGDKPAQEKVGKSSTPLPHRRNFSIVGTEHIAIASPSDIRTWLKARFRQYLLLLATLAVRQSPWLAHLCNLRFHDTEILYVGNDTPVLCRVEDLALGVKISLSSSPELPALVETNGESNFPYSPSSVGSPSSSPFSFAASLPSSPFSEGTSPFAPPSFSPFGTRAASPDGFQRPPQPVPATRVRTPAPASKRDVAMARFKKTRAGRLMVRAMGRAAGTAEISLSMGSINVIRLEDAARWRGLTKSLRVQLSNANSSPERRNSAPGDRLISMEEGTHMTLAFQFGRDLYMTRNTIELDVGVAPTSCWVAQSVQTVKLLVPPRRTLHPRDLPGQRKKELVEKKQISAALGNLKFRLAMIEAIMDVRTDATLERCEMLVLRIDDVDLVKKSIAISRSEVLRGYFGVSPVQGDPEQAITLAFRSRRTFLEYTPVQNPSIRTMSAVKPRKVLSVSGVSIEGVTTCTPGQKEEFPTMSIDQLMLAIVQCSADIGSLRLNIEPASLLAISSALSPFAARSPSTKLKTSQALPLLPRALLDFHLGEIEVTMQPTDEGSSLPTLHCAGLNGGLSTSYLALTARNRDQGSATRALRAEEAFNKSAAAQTEEAQRTKYDKRFSEPVARSQDDMDFSLQLFGHLRVEPMSVHGGTPFGNYSSSPQIDEEIMRCFAIDGIDVALDLSCLGQGDEHTSPRHLIGKSMLCKVEASAGRGIELHIVNTETARLCREVVSAIQTVREIVSVRPRGTEDANIPRRPRLPSGLDLSLSLGNVIIVLASVDSNPTCPAGLWRGYKVSTRSALQYCFFSDITQTRRSRHADSAAGRRKLGLGESASVEALSLENQSRNGSSSTALLTFRGASLHIDPVYDASQEVFVWFQAPPQSPAQDLFPRRPRADSCIGWDFQRVRAQQEPSSKTKNAVDPIMLTLQDEGRKPLLSLSHHSGKIYLHEERGTTPATLNSVIRVSPATCNVTMAHVYCAMLAGKAISNTIGKARKPHGKAQAAGPSPQYAMNGATVYLERLSVSMALPLGERVFIALKAVNAKIASALYGFGVDSAMAFVPSPTSVGRWEEIARMKAISAGFSRRSSPTGSRLSIGADAIRLRVPFRYEVAKLILNLNTAAKAAKLLRRDLSAPGFPLVRHPQAEGPKQILPISISILRFAFDIKDDPLESKLNLIWRVGQEEQLERLERASAFEAKAAAIAQAEGEVDPKPGAARGRWRFDAVHSVPMEEAYIRLMAYDGRQWASRLTSSLSERNRREQLMVARVHGVRSDEFELPIDVLPPARSAPLFRMVIDRLQIEVEPPLWDRERSLMHMERLAGRYPAGTEFSLLVPLSIKMTADSIDGTLRDYPLPLLRVPAVKTGVEAQSAPKTPAFTMTTLMVVAEELPKDGSFILLPCTVLPDEMGRVDSKQLQLSIAKSPMSIKTFAEPLFAIQTPHPTDFTWGTAYQPAIQDLTKVLETFSHPQRDPSPKMGFWDKFRLNLHWRVTLNFADACHLHLKGSRDPYEITGKGAGFVLAWKGAVKVTVGVPNEQQETIQVKGNTMILSIPDLTAFMDATATGTAEADYPDAGKPPEELPSLLERRGNKTCARFANGARVGFGFRFERSCRDLDCAQGCRGDPSERRCRMFDFKPHHQVTLRTPEAYEADAKRAGYITDSFDGFRSDFIHFSLSLSAAGSGEEADLPSNIHMTPHGFAHFNSWWRLFNHAMSLPIRQGSLFPRSPPASKKFGRSLGTIKYRFNIAPLYISHFYSPGHADDWTKGETTSVGVKARIGHFQADAHQREQEKVSRNDVLGGFTTIKHKPFYAAEVYLDDVHLRAIIATFDDADKLLLNSTGTAEKDHRGARARGIRVSAQPESESRWYTFDDFVDTDQRPADRDPQLQMYDIASCPRLHYSKWVPARRMSSKVVEEIQSAYLPLGAMEASKFGRESTHDCLMHETESAIETHQKMFSERVKALQEDIRSVHATSGTPIEAERKKMALQTRLRILEQHMRELEQNALQSGYEVDEPDATESDLDHREGMTTREGAAFQNVYHIHQPRISLNNESRNVILKYYFSNRGQKGFEYHMSNAALSLLKQQLDQALGKSAANVPKPSLDPRGIRQDKIEQVTEKSTNLITQGLLKLLTPDTENRAAPQEGEDADEKRGSLDGQIDPSYGLPKAYQISKSHFLHLIGPQISLASELDPGARVLIAASMATFRGFTVKDSDIVSDDVNAVVLHRHYASLLSLQGFHPAETTPKSGFGGLFVPLENVLDVKSELPDFDRIISRADAKLRYDKFNQLRLKYNVRLMEDSRSGPEQFIEDTQDLCVVDMPRFAVMANERHYSTLYNVITNLLLYQDPEYKERMEVLEAYAYAFDPRDSRRFIREVAAVQTWIRGLHGLVQGYEDNYSELPLEGRRELESIKHEFVTAADKLSMLFDLVATAKSQDVSERSDLLLSTRLEAHAGEVAWFMLGDNGGLIAKLAIREITFQWTKKKDSSTENVMAVRELLALNSDPAAQYTEMVSRFNKNGRNINNKAFLQATWSVLAPVGGITIIEHFGLQLHPVKIQLEKRVGKQIMDYFFNDRKARALDDLHNGRRSLEGTSSLIGTSKGSTKVAEPLMPHRPEPELSAWKLRRSRSRNNSMLSLSSAADRSTPAISRQASNTDLTSTEITVPTAFPGRPVRRGSGDSIASMHAAFVEEKEMRARATTNRTFVSINVDSTSLVLSYKGDKPRSLTDLHDLRFDTPPLRYENKTWSFEALVAQVRKDYIKAAWTQKGQLVKSLISRSKPTHITHGTNHAVNPVSRLEAQPAVPSALRYSVQAPSPQDSDRATFTGSPSASDGTGTRCTPPNTDMGDVAASGASGAGSKGKMGRLWHKLVTSHPDGQDHGSDEKERNRGIPHGRQRSSSVALDSNARRPSLSRLKSRQ